MKKKTCFVALLIFLLAQSMAWDEDPWTESLKKISSLVEIIEENYFEEIDHEKLAYASIRGMLPTLDPHSYFLDPKNLSTLREDYKGKYYGLGIMIQKHGDRIMVISPIAGTPAYQLGIQPGDVISHIEGESTKPITSFQAMQKLRGKKGTKVNITIVREGQEPLDYTITRAEIPLHSVRYAFMLKDDIGYIYISNFAATTTNEFQEKMALLEKQGMKKLILDFRMNGGGTLMQSLEISDELLPKEAGIVSIKGRKSFYNQEFHAVRDNQYEHIPLVIIIHQGTASAPEIVSGAVQDNDRGLIVGAKSFGKGLVQTVFPLSKDAALALTTAKYYTPSGRSIQRDYSNIEDWAMNRELPDEDREVRYTANGRKVLGQGGITPDYVVDFSYKPLTYHLLVRGVFFAYGRKFGEKKTSLSKQLSEEQLKDPGFTIDSRVLDDFKDYLKENKISFTQEGFDESREQIVREIERNIVIAVWGIDAGEKAYRLSDPFIKKAFEVFPEAETMIK